MNKKKFLYDYGVKQNKFSRFLNKSLYKIPDIIFDSLESTFDRVSLSNIDAISELERRLVIDNQILTAEEYSVCTDHLFIQPRHSPNDFSYYHGVTNILIYEEVEKAGLIEFIENAHKHANCIAEESANINNIIGKALNLQNSILLQEVIHLVYLESCCVQAQGGIQVRTDHLLYNKLSSSIEKGFTREVTVAKTLDPSDPFTTLVIGEFWENLEDLKEDLVQNLEKHFFRIVNEDLGKLLKPSEYSDVNSRNSEFSELSKYLKSCILNVEPIEYPKKLYRVRFKDVKTKSSDPNVYFKTHNPHSLNEIDYMDVPNLSSYISDLTLLSSTYIPEEVVIRRNPYVYIELMSPEYSEAKSLKYLMEKEYIEVEEVSELNILPQDIFFSILSKADKFCLIPSSCLFNNVYSEDNLDVLTPAELVRNISNGISYPLKFINGFFRKNHKGIIEVLKDLNFRSKNLGSSRLSHALFKPSIKEIDYEEILAALIAEDNLTKEDLKFYIPLILKEYKKEFPGLSFHNLKIKMKSELLNFIKK